MSQLYTKTYKITATKDTLHKLESFFAFMHYNGGHSGLFAMPFDGDGHERLHVEPAPDESLRRPSQSIAQTGAHVEIAYEGEYGGRFIDYSREEVGRDDQAEPGDQHERMA